MSFKLGIVQLDHSPEEIRCSKLDPESVISLPRVQHTALSRLRDLLDMKNLQC